MKIEHFTNGIQESTYVLTAEDGEQYVAYESDLDYKAIAELQAQLEQERGKVKTLRKTMKSIAGVKLKVVQPVLASIKHVAQEALAHTTGNNDEA